MCIIDYIKDNSNWIKDISTILFTATGTVIAILTYLRAKATILQPKRTEVIKKQTEILSDFLTLISENNNSIDSGLDYVNLLNYNVDLALREYGLIDIPKDSEKYKEFNGNIAGWIQFLENDIYDFVFIEGSMEIYDNSIFEKDNRLRQRFYEIQAKNNNIAIHRIFYTHRHIRFYKKLKDFWNNPFLTTEMHKIAYEIGKNIHLNIHYDLRVILQKLVEEYSKAILENKAPDEEILTEKFRHETLFRVFEKERKHHDKDYESLKEIIQKHLMIDNKW